MEHVGRSIAEDQWSAACALACYRVSEELRPELFCEEYNILDEPDDRITHSRVEDDELHNVIVFGAGSTTTGNVNALACYRAARSNQ